jgi:hypothetical protein
MPYCGDCGAQVNPTQKFCYNCGQPLGPEETAAQGAPAPRGVAAQGAPAPQGGPAQQWAPPGARAQARPRRRLLWLWLTLAAVPVAAAIGLVLGLVVFAGDNGPASTPEETVQRALVAAEKEDTDALFSLLSPALKERIVDDVGGRDFETIQDDLGDYLRSRFSVKFTDVEMNVYDGGARETYLELVSGTMVVTDEADEYQNGRFDIYDEGGSEFYLVKIDDAWYIDDFDAYWEIIESEFGQAETTTTAAAPYTTTTVATTATTAAPPETGPIKIGVALSLTGAYAGLGQAVMDALVAEVTVVNDSGGYYGRPVELILKDDQSNEGGDRAGAVIGGLIHNDEVDVILGPMTEDAVANAQAMAEEAGIPLMPLTMSVVGDPRESTTDLQASAEWVLDWAILQVTQ